MKSIALLGLASVLALVPVFARAESHAAPSTDPMILRGTVLSWRLDMDGTVHLQLRELPSGDSDRSEQSPRTLWFRTPPDRSVTMAVEDLVMAIALDTEQSTALTLSAESNRSRSGETPEESFELNWIRGD